MPRARSSVRDDRVELHDAGVSIDALPWGRDVRDDALARSIESVDADDANGTSALFYVARPLERESRGVVVVVHTALGAWETFTTTCADALASLGYDAIVPDLYGTRKCVWDVETKRRIRGGTENRAAFGAKAVIKCVEAFRSKTGETKPYAAIGFCLGGQVCLDLVRGLGASDEIEDVRAVASFHGVLDAPELEGGSVARNAKVRIFHGSKDPFSSPSSVHACLDDLKRRGADDVVLFEYEGCMHAFTRPEKVRPEDLETGFAYDAEAAETSWRECVRMLEETFRN